MKLTPEITEIPTGGNRDILLPKTEAPDQDGSLDDTDLEFTPGIEDSHDPVRTYLRQMGAVALLTREGEVALAQRIERGEALVSNPHYS